MKPIKHSLCHLVFLFLFTITASACAKDPVTKPNANASITLTPGASQINADEVPKLHEKTPTEESEVSLTLRGLDQHDWIIASTEKSTKLNFDIKSRFIAADEQLIATIWDWDNRPVATMRFDQDGDDECSVQVQGQGVYMLTLDGLREGKLAYRLVRSFAVIRDQRSLQNQWKQCDYWLGICAFPGRYHWNSSSKPTKPESITEEKARELEAEAMAKLGLTVARLDVSMVLPENDKTSIDWKRMDAAVNAYTSRGFELALQLMHPPDWAMEEKYKSETKDRWRFPRREKPYRRYVRAIVERYGKHAKFVQVYNEPDQLAFWAASPEEFVTELSRAREEIRKVLPKVDIANGGYAFIDPKRTEYFTQEFKGKTELQAYHSHGNLRELERDVTHMRQLHQAAGYEKPHYVNTECGFAAWRLDQERAQAASVVQKILYSWAHGDEGMLLFASRMTKAPGRSGRDFGFLDYDFCPRFVYGTVSALIERLAGAKFEKTLIESEDMHAYLFKRGQEWIVGYFSVGASTDMTVVTDAKHVGGFDAMGNGQDVMLERDGTVSVKAGALVKWLVLEGGMRVEVKKQ